MAVTSTTLVTNLNADRVDNLHASSFLRSDANDTTTGQIIFTKANSTSNGGGQIYLNGGTGNRIDWNTNGVASPTTSTRSVGTKLVLYPGLTASNVDYALGIASGTLWYSVNSTSGIHKWYGGTQTMMSLTGNNLDVTGTVRGTRFISDVAQGTAPFQVTSTTKVTNLNADLLDGLTTSSTNQSGDTLLLDLVVTLVEITLTQITSSVVLKSVTLLYRFLKLMVIMTRTLRCSTQAGRHLVS